MSIYYNDSDNSFEDDSGEFFYDISDIMPIDDIAKYKKVGGTYYYIINGESVEIEFPIRDSIRTLNYDALTNVMYDEEGDILFNMFSIITPNDLYMFKTEKQSITITKPSGDILELN